MPKNAFEDAARGPAGGRAACLLHAVAAIALLRRRRALACSSLRPLAARFSPGGGPGFVGVPGPLRFSNVAA